MDDFIVARRNMMITRAARGEPVAFEEHNTTVLVLTTELGMYRIAAVYLCEFGYSDARNSWYVRVPLNPNGSPIVP